MTKVLGGHAIMLRVRIPEELVKVACDWIREKPDVRQLKISPSAFAMPGEIPPYHGHVTLCFVGRDKAPEVGEKMLEATEAEAAQRWKALLKLKPGSLARLGFKRDHLAVEIVPNEDLFNLACMIKQRLAGKQVSCKEEFGWNPHVTLATGEPGFSWEVNCSSPFDLQLPVEGLEVKIGSNRTEFLPL